MLSDLVVTQWLSAALGGYLAGRLRTKSVGVHTDEVFFRDTAHGFLAWALATLIGAALLVAAMTWAVTETARNASTVTAEQPLDSRSSRARQPPAPRIPWAI